MPVLPYLYRRAAASEDTRILDSRQLQAAAHSLATPVKRLVARIPHITVKRNSNSQACQFGYIPGCYQFGGATPGAVVGITLGAIVGFLLVLWLLWALSQGTTFVTSSALQEEERVVTRSRRSRSPRSRRSHRSTYQTEMRHSSPRRERVIRQERIVRDVPPPRRDMSRVRETVIVEESRPERRVEGDDVVEVIEEHSSIGGAPPPRRKSRRNSGYR